MFQHSVAHKAQPYEAKGNAIQTDLLKNKIQFRSKYKWKRFLLQVGKINNIGLSAAKTHQLQTRRRPQQRTENMKQAVMMACA